MKIRDITIWNIRAGKNWRLTRPNDDGWLDLRMEEWGPIVEVTEFLPNDQIVYSGITVYPDGRVKPIVCIREVRYLDTAVITAAHASRLGLIPCAAVHCQTNG